ncbi:MAG: aspartate kinase [Bacillota bacterium]|nr:aspartate kinase [Bacillota bacterium]
MRDLVVMKFGGTSVATDESREQVYKKIIKQKNKGKDVLVVVSAMGRTGDPYATDTILDLIRKTTKNYSMREIDMAFVCGEMISAAIVSAKLNEYGYKAMSINGMQAGIYTDGLYFDADIVKIDTTKIEKHLDEGNILIVTGGQGITEDKEITTLGRGGSDTTATALGVVLGAKKAIIYTDVEGIMTTDPRIEKNAQIIRKLDYNDCCTLAEEGAKVIHPRAVKEAMKNKKMQLYVRSTFSDDLGTHIGTFKNGDDAKIVGITKKDLGETSMETKVTVVGNKLMELKKTIFEKIAGIRINNYNLDERKFEFYLDVEDSNLLIEKLHNLK